MSTTFTNGTTYPFPTNTGFNPNAGPYGWGTCQTTGNLYPIPTGTNPNFTNPNFSNPNFNPSGGTSFNTFNPFANWTNPIFGSPTPAYIPTFNSSFNSPTNPYAGNFNPFVNTLGGPTFIPTPWGFVPSFPTNAWFNPSNGFGSTNWSNPWNWTNSFWGNTTPTNFGYSRGIPFNGFVPSFNPGFANPNFGNSQGIFGTSMFHGFPGFPTSWFNPGPFGYAGMPTPNFSNPTNTTYQNGTDKTGSCCVGLAA
ncbi:MAG: hypothetical protein JNM80_05060 [Phycisphaerae bacterium]|nr:hypothetical protein [Phycisphaerae bacterium]